MKFLTMKNRYIVILGLGFMLGSCSLITSLPSGTYMQNLDLVAKPTYQGKDTNMIRISGGYSLMDIYFSEGTWTENGDTLWSQDYGGRGSWIESGFVELTYGRSSENMSYGFGLFGSYGQFNEVFSDLGNSIQTYNMAGVGAKANFSWDLNKQNFTMRALQLQIGISRDFNEYAESRQDIADSYPNFAAVPHLAPSNALFGDISLSNTSQFYFNDFRIGLGGGVNFSGALSEGLAPDLSTVAGMLVVDVGYDKVDLFLNYYRGIGVTRNIGSNFRVGLAYRFGF